MKRLLFLLLIIIVVLESTEAKDIKGKIIYLNDTVDVIFVIPTDFTMEEIRYRSIQNKVKYYNSAGKKVKLLPDDVVEIRFSYSNEDIRMLSVRDTHDFNDIWGTKYIFLKLIVDGRLKLFEYHFSDSNMSGMNYVTNSYILKKNNGVLWWPEKWTFRKDMINYLSDCPELTRQIQEKEFEKSDLVNIVKFYNTNCK
jgi:hypothetical protein